MYVTMKAADTGAWGRGRGALVGGASYTTIRRVSGHLRTHSGHGSNDPLTPKEHRDGPRHHPLDPSEEDPHAESHRRRAKQQRRPRPEGAAKSSH